MAGDFIIVVLHVDDQNVFASSRPLLVELKTALKVQYIIDDIGETKYFLGSENLRGRTRKTMKL